MDMFTIDLFEGQELPARNQGLATALTSVTLVVPVVAVLVLIGIFTTNQVKISVARHKLDQFKASQSTKQYKTNLADKLKHDQEKIMINKCLAQVAQTIKSKIQWTHIIMEIVSNLPDDMVIDSMQVLEKTDTIQVSDAAQPDQNKNKNIVTRSLKIGIAGLDEKSYYNELENYKRKLANSSGLINVIDNINVEREKNSYQLVCNFKADIY